MKSITGLNAFQKRTLPKRQISFKAPKNAANCHLTGEEAFLLAKYIRNAKVGCKKQHFAKKHR
jgi:hypothetical protein